MFHWKWPKGKKLQQLLIRNIYNLKKNNDFSYAESVGAKHFETSAKNNIGVEELFLELTNLVN